MKNEQDMDPASTITKNNYEKGRTESEDKINQQMSSFSFSSETSLADSSLPRNHMYGPTSKDAEIVRRHREIVRRLLDEFDLEDTIERYKTLSTVDFKIDPSNVPISSEMECRKAKQRIFDLMGTDVIQFCNQKFNRKLQKKLMEEEQRQRREHERSLAEAECNRLRRLYIDGIIESPHIYDTKWKKEQKCQSREKTTSRISSTSRKHHRHHSKRRHSTRSRVKNGHSLESDSHKHGIQTPETMVQRLAAKEEQEYMEQLKHTTEGTDSDSGYSGSSSRNRKTFHPKIDKLYKEETLEGLYSTAIEIVGPWLSKKNVSHNTRNEDTWCPN